MKNNRVYSYCTGELAKLKNSEYNKSLIIWDGSGNKTWEISLNKGTIPILIRYLLDEFIKE